MPSQKKHINKYNSLLAVAITLIIPTLCFSQTIIKGRVLYKGGKPSGASANVVIANSVSLETHTSENGSFSLVVPDPRSTDTVIISSVGYNSIRLPLKAAASKTEFVLIATVKSMEGVTVFSTQQTIGSTEEKVGYYRSWKHENRGGEIGRFFTYPMINIKLTRSGSKPGTPVIPVC